MNNGTLVVVCGYAGDAHQIEELLPYYEHHKRPILFLSPEDSRIESVGTHVGQFAGKRCYVGQDSLDRQHLHMKAALDLNFDWYLFNDSDSICISPEIPPYLYENEDIVWSNQVDDFREKGYHDPLPHIAMQPPYFMSRKVLTKYVEHGAQVACPTTPFIDWYMVQVAYAAGVEHRSFPHTASFVTTNEEALRHMEDKIRDGASMLHSIKTGDVAKRLWKAYEGAFLS